MDWILHTGTRGVGVGRDAVDSLQSPREASGTVRGSGGFIQGGEMSQKTEAPSDGSGGTRELSLALNQRSFLSAGEQAMGQNRQGVCHQAESPLLLATCEARHLP